MAAAMSKRPPQLSKRLEHLEHIGDAVDFASQIQALIPKCPLLENFSTGEVRLLTHFMQMYRAGVGTEIIREGESGDFMLMILEGRVEVRKRDRESLPQLVATVDAGKTLGEMSMIDGEARFASCSAIEDTTFAYLSRPSLQDLITHEPRLASKILMKLVFMLSQRLRQTSAKLVNYLEQ